MPQTSNFGELEQTQLSAVIDSGLLWRGNGANWGGQQGPGGSKVDRFEDAFRDWLGLPFVHAVNSGTSANEAALASLGLEPGDEVICPSASPIFVPLAVLAVGCIPVFADVDAETMLLDPANIEALVSDRTRAVVAVHLWGHPAPMAEIVSAAQALGLLIVEDCAQSFASTLSGKRVGTFGDAASFSLQQSKLISSGEGGIVASRSREGYARAVLYSNTGIPSFRYGIGLGDVGIESEALAVFGHNHRMSELAAAVALAQLERLDAFIGRRAEQVRVVEHELAESTTEVRLLRPVANARVSYWRCPVFVPAGQGTYVGIPQLEPVFARMQRRRCTPFGMPLADHIQYGPSHCPGARSAASRIRVVPLQHAQTDDDVRVMVQKVLSDA